MVASEGGAVGLLTVRVFTHIGLRTSGSTSIGSCPLGPGVWSLCFLLVEVGCLREVHLVQ